MTNVVMLARRTDTYAWRIRNLSRRLMSIVGPNGWRCVMYARETRSFPDHMGFHAFLLLVVAIHGVVVVYEATTHSLTANESGHLVAGVAHWELGRFDLYRVNPPLVRMVAAAPVVMRGCRVAWVGYSAMPGARAEFSLDRKFVYLNRERLRSLVFLSRCAVLVFTIVGAITCFLWARELFGREAGFVACALWCFSPTIIGNAWSIVPDVGAAALGTVAAYAMWLWLRRPTWSGAYLAGIALGVAELTKTTLVLFFVIWPVIWLVRMLRAPRDPFGVTYRRKWVREIAQIAFCLTLSIFVLNLGYGFEGSFRRLGSYRFVSQSLGHFDVTCHQTLWGNRFSDTWFGTMRVPLPANYVMGIDTQKRDFEQCMRSYLGGRWQSRGWWYYYVYCLAVKTPIGLWILTLVAMGWALFARGGRTSWTDELMLIAPALGIFVLVSSQTGFSHHFRYVLPVFPFVFIWISRVGKALSRGPRLFGGLVCIGLCWIVAASVSVYPHNLSYFNSLIGGPRHGHDHLVNSNIDWGQDLFYLKSWLDRHPEARPFHLAYFGQIDPELAAIRYDLPPRALQLDKRFGASAYEGPQPGWHAVSVALLRGRYWRISDGHGGRFSAGHPYFSYFLRLKPVAMAGYSIYVYHVTEADAARLRRELGYLPLAAGTKGQVHAHIE